MHTNKSLFNYYVIYVGEGGGGFGKSGLYTLRLAEYRYGGFVRLGDPGGWNN